VHFFGTFFGDDEMYIVVPGGQRKDLCINAMHYNYIWHLWIDLLFVLQEQECRFEKKRCFAYIAHALNTSRVEFVRLLEIATPYTVGYASPIAVLLKDIPVFDLVLL
jgi:hypothetical protein